MAQLRLTIVLAALVLPATLRAAGDVGTPAAADDPVLASVAQAKAREDWAGAAATLKGALARDPANADYHNLYAYALRKSPDPDMDLVFRHYGEALRLVPGHRGAHEYIGEAYLMVGNLPKAREHLAALDRLCLFGCEEYDDLKRAVARYESRTRR